MEIPEIHMITDLGEGVKLLQNPVLSSFSPFSLLRWWKFGALVLAIFATFRSLIKRSRLILIISRNFRGAPNRIDEILDLGEDDLDSVASSDDERDSLERVATTTVLQGQRRRSEEFGVKGSRFSFKGCGGGWSEFNPGKSVVNLWDSLGLSLDFDEDLFDFDSKSVVATWESDDVPASSSLVLTAEGNGNGDGVIVSGYDSRIRRRSPALYAEWDSPTEKVTGVISDGVRKVYVRDDVNGVMTVGDVRKVGRPFARNRC